jgi:hypothetical protein
MIFDQVPLGYPVGIMRKKNQLKIMSIFAINNALGAWEF